MQFRGHTSGWRCTSGSPPPRASLAGRPCLFETRLCCPDCTGEPGWLRWAEDSGFTKPNVLARASCVKGIKGHPSSMILPFRTNLTLLSHSDSPKHLHGLNAIFPSRGTSTRTCTHVSPVSPPVGGRPQQAQLPEWQHLCSGTVGNNSYCFALIS